MSTDDIGRGRSKLDFREATCEVDSLAPRKVGSRNRSSAGRNFKPLGFFESGEKRGLGGSAAKPGCTDNPVKWAELATAGAPEHYPG